VASVVVVTSFAGDEDATDLGGGSRSLVDWPVRSEETETVAFLGAGRISPEATQQLIRISKPLMLVTFSRTLGIPRWSTGQQQADRFGPDNKGFDLTA
jgi:hypothetical protein